MACSLPVPLPCCLQSSISIQRGGLEFKMHNVMSSLSRRTQAVTTRNVQYIPHCSASRKLLLPWQHTSLLPLRASLLQLRGALKNTPTQTVVYTQYTDTYAVCVRACVQACVLCTVCVFVCICTCAFCILHLHS